MPDDTVAPFEDRVACMIGIDCQCHLPFVLVRVLVHVAIGIMSIDCHPLMVQLHISGAQLRSFVTAYCVDERSDENLFSRPNRSQLGPASTAVRRCGCLKLASSVMDSSHI